MAPKDWQRLRIGDLLKLSSGRPRPKDMQQRRTRTHIHPVYGGNGVMGFTSEWNVDGEIVVIGRVGEYCGITHLVNGKAWITDNALYPTEMRMRVDQRFLQYLLQYEDLARLRAKGGQPLVTQRAIHSLVTTLPPQAEQTSIADRLSTWDEAIGVVEQLVAAKREFKRGLMQALLTGKKRFKEFKSTGPFERLFVKDIAEVDARQLSSDTSPEFAFKYVSLSDVSQGRINRALPHMRFAEAPSRARQLVQKRDVLLSTVRPNLKGFAMIGVDADSLVVSTGFAVLSARRGMDPGYLYHYLFSDDMTKQIEALVTGSNYPAISKRDVKRLQVNVPTLLEQRMISSVLTTADAEIETLEKQLEAYKLQKRGLMQQLLTGKKRMRVKGSEPVPA